MKISFDLLLKVGAKQIWPPKKFGKRYAEKKSLLVAIVHTPFGEHFKEVYCSEVLDEIRHAPMNADYFELNEKSIVALKAELP